MVLAGVILIVLTDEEINKGEEGEGHDVVMFADPVGESCDLRELEV